MEKTVKKDNNKKINIVRLMLYISTALILISAVMCFVPFVVHKNSGVITKFAGIDFTKAMFTDEQSVKMEAVRSLLGSSKTKLVARTIAYLCPASLILSVVMCFLTMMSTFYKKLNNIFAVGLFFAVWVVLMMSVISLVGRLAIIKGVYVINNYSVGIGVVVGVACVLTASIINIVAAFMLDAKPKPVSTLPKANIPPMGR